MSAGEALAAVTTIYKVATKVRSHGPRNGPSYSLCLHYAQVKDNMDDLMRVSLSSNTSYCRLRIVDDVMQFGKMSTT
jgi:hypothetical protein